MKRAADARREMKKSTSQTGHTRKAPKKDAGDSEKGKKKKDTVWNHGNQKVTKEAMASLDRSQNKGEESGEVSEAVLEAMRKEFIDEDADDIDSVEDTDASWSFGSSRLGSFLKRISGNQTLTEEDLEPVLKDVHIMLVGKNVASEVADDLCNSISTSLVGQNLGSFDRVKKVVMQTLEAALVRILTPKKSTDVLREVLASKAKGSPYVIVFVGVNGVGKSTSLSKVAYYLKNNGCKVV